MKFTNRSRGVLVIALMTCLPMSGAWATHRAEAEQAIAEAQAAHEKAASKNAAAPETAAMIEQARELLASRQFTKALEIANKARTEDTFTAEQESRTAKATDAGAKGEEALASIRAAEEARKKAAAVGGEWRDTAEMITNAEGLANSGNDAEAIDLANKAKRQGELGYTQAMREKNAGIPSYVYKKP